MLNTLKVRSKSVAVLISLTVFAVLLSAIELYVNKEAAIARSERKLEAIAYGNTLQSRVERELNTLLYVTSGLSSYIKAYHHSLDRAKLNKILSDLHDQSQHVRNFGIAVGLKITYVYPVKGNEKAIGLDYTTLPEQLAKVQHAIATQKGILDGPLTLVQGGQAMIYRYPIFINDAYWGIISTVINTSSFFTAAFSEVHSERYDFAIRKLDDAGAPGAAFYGDPALFNHSQAVLVTREVPNGTWQWAVLDKAAYQTTTATKLIRALGWALSLVLAIMSYLLLRERAQLEQYALYDGLTGLPNRRLLLDRLEQNLRRLGRARNEICSVFFFDLNGFKQINDTYGHQAGDAVLVTIAQRVTEEVRSIDTVSRLGGDEFVVVMNHEKNGAVLETLEQKLRDSILRPMDYKGHELKVGTAIGVATYPFDGNSPADLIKIADSRMYIEKKLAYQNKDTIPAENLSL